ncbi:hypothetical protein FLONG3_6428 [Fusarium longipes]|uniref:Uncharacterized protein n=1 Tax=Fusarium longipes TaxID=694270 RepID=A0A395SM22_9HYPO|nr:hypothetical protein FLONG3_6428 [Fusarium longipes]
MSPSFVPVLTITAPDGTQVPATIFGVPAKPEELASTEDFIPFEQEETPAPAASGQTITKAEIDAMSLDDMLAVTRNDHAEIVQVKAQEKEDTACSILPDALSDILEEQEKEEEDEKGDDDDEKPRGLKRKRDGEAV